MTEKPAYLLAAEAMKHFGNKNYGLAQSVLLDLWSLLVSEHHEEAGKREQEKESEKESE